MTKAVSIDVHHAWYSWVCVNKMNSSWLQSCGEPRKKKLKLLQGQASLLCDRSHPDDTLHWVIMSLKPLLDGDSVSTSLVFWMTLTVPRSTDHGREVPFLYTVSGYISSTWPVTVVLTCSASQVGFSPAKLLYFFPFQPAHFGRQSPCTACLGREGLRSPPWEQSVCYSEFLCMRD